MPYPTRKTALETALADAEVREQIRRLIEDLPLAEDPRDILETRFARRRVAIWTEALMERLGAIGRAHADELAMELHSPSTVGAALARAKAVVLV